jgi:hypothetical protein
MRKRWIEMWSVGNGPDRTYCGVARTADGYAVDVFRGDLCVASDIYPGRRLAEDAARALKRRYDRSARSFAVRGHGRRDHNRGAELSRPASSA